MRKPDADDGTACDEGDHFEQRYRHLIDHCPDMICMHQGGRLVCVNPAGVRWLGGTSEEQFIGREIAEFVHPDYVSAMSARIASLRETGDASDLAELVMLRLDGTPQYVESVSVRTVWRGKPAYQVVLRDLSAQKAAEETQRYRQLIENCPDMICVHQSGRTVYINPAGIRWLGGTSEEQFIGHPITKFVHPDSVPPLLARIATLGNVGDASTPTEMILRRVDGTFLDVETVSVRTVWEGKPAYQVVLRDLSAQKAVEDTLRYQAALVNHVSDAVIATTYDGVVTSWNPAAEAIYRRPQAEALSKQISEVVGAPLDPLAIAVDGVLETTHHASDGAALAVRVSVTAMDQGFVLMVSDHTARRRAEQHFQTVVQSLEEGVMVVNSDGRVASVNPAGRGILGVDDLDRLNEHFPCAAAEHDETAIDCIEGALCTAIRAREPQAGLILSFDRFSDGKQRWLSLNSRLLNPEDPDDSAVLISFTDVTAQRQVHEQLQHSAAHDALTGLFNRAQIMACIDEHLDSTATDRLGGVLFMDLDDFKAINDTRGHHAGDQALKAVAKHLKASVRSSDVVGRLGGDEFVALILGQITRAVLDKLAARIHAALAEPTRVGDDLMGLRTSVGIVIVEDDDPRDGSQILRDADTAMYAAKHQGGSATCYFTDVLPPSVSS
ncbi:diguanylate cyclase [Mycobacterium haemophilum]